MNGILTSLIAVFATLAGSALTFLFQRHAAQQAEQLGLLHDRVTSELACPVGRVNDGRVGNAEGSSSADAP